MGAFTNDVMILGGGGLEGMAQDDGGCWAKDDVTFSYDFWGKFQTILFLKDGFIIVIK